MAGTKSSSYEKFTAEERAAMKEHAQEQKAAARRGARTDKTALAEQDVLSRIDEMQGAGQGEGPEGARGRHRGRAGAVVRHARRAATVVPGGG